VNSGNIWIDLDNTPHVPFFRPIIGELETRGYSVLVTSRKCFQVCELADMFNLSHKSIGRHYGKNKIAKLFGTIARAAQLSRAAVKTKPLLAISHGSRSQMMAAKFLRIPSLEIIDYEFTKAIPFMKPSWRMAPNLVSNENIKVNSFSIIKYPGIKEDIYVPFFQPDPAIIDEIGLNREHINVLIRPPATEAHYHNPESDYLFEAVIDYLEAMDNIQMVLLPRNQKQAQLIQNKWDQLFSNGKILIPQNAVDGLNLIWHCDMVISGGGTMNREAAALGVPVYSIFRGKIGAVDKYLNENGRLVFLENEEDVRSKLLLQPWNRPSTPQVSNPEVLNYIVDQIAKIVEAEGLRVKR